jgi:AraC-like DNA-binding protein
MARRKTDRRRERLLLDAERVIRRRYGEFDLSLVDIARDVDCSTRQLQRIFREVGGTDFRSHLLKVRLERARRLLSRKTNAPSVRAVARQVGYREASGLRQQFVRYFGVNPSDVRAPPTDYDALWRANEKAANNFRTVSPVSGYDDLAIGLRVMDELRQDDPRVIGSLVAAIESGDLSDEDTGLAYSALGSCLHATGQQEQARDALQHAIRLMEDPQRLAIAHHELGETFFVLEQMKKAEKHFRESLAYDKTHSFVPDTLILLARVIHMQAQEKVGRKLIEESYSFFDEAVALLEAPDGEKYGTVFRHEKALFDGYFGKAICKSDMPRDKERFEAVPFFEQAEQIALEWAPLITRAELENVYECWAGMLNQMGS